MKSSANPLEEAREIASRLEWKKSDLQQAGAADAGFPVKITATEVDIAVQHLRTMEEEVPWLNGGEPYGTVAANFPLRCPFDDARARCRGGAYHGQQAAVQLFVQHTALCCDFVRGLRTGFCAGAGNGSG